MHAPGHRVSEDEQPGSRGRNRAEAAAPVDTLVASWLSAFVAAESAIRINAGHLTPADAGKRLHDLRVEREEICASLETLVQGQRAASLLLHCLSRPTIDIRLLGLPSGVTACIFDVEGALTTSASAHRDVWCATLDSFLLARAERLGRPFVPLDPHHDYPDHLAGRPRLTGLRAFLASRGISLPDGEPSDLPGAESVHGLATESTNYCAATSNKKVSTHTPGHAPISSSPESSTPGAPSSQRAPTPGWCWSTPASPI